MPTAVVELDKTWHSEAGETYGTLQIRVVVLSKKVGDTEKLAEPEPDSDEEEPLDIDEKSPLANYLERPKHGRMCAVFVVNGQRHDGWDNSFLVRDLGLKYLKSRTMVIVNLDGIAPEALAKLMQGSRQGFFKGEVYQAVRERIIATLKGDPDLKRLQIEAEEEISSLESGDSAVKNALDQLIDDHHAAAARATVGVIEAGASATENAGVFGPDKQQPVVIAGDERVGAPGELPLLAKGSEAKTIRLQPDKERVLRIRCQPIERWVDLCDMKLVVEPETPDLVAKLARDDRGARLTLCFYEPDDFDDEEYPVVAAVKVFALFDGEAEPRLVEYAVVVNKPKVRDPIDPPVLREEPTFLRVTSRKPVKLPTGGPSTHVRLRWDGLDSLAVGDPPAWTFTATCLDLATFSVTGFSRPQGGKFELLLDTPPSLLRGAELSFEVKANGPNGKSLVATFPAVVVEPEAEKADGPRRLQFDAPEAVGQRKPPYDLRYVTKKDWEHPNCWGDAEWTENDAGCFVEPTETNPLTLLINKDAQLLRSYQDYIVKVKKLEPSNVQKRLTKYTAHLSFHLFQMYEFMKARRTLADDAEEVHIPTDSEMQAEANRVAATLIRLMEVSA